MNPKTSNSSVKMRIKKLHLFILKSFLGPLVMTFFIALFILVMQFLWRYVDDLVGKGLEWYVMGELLFYASMQVVPMALPLSILLASLMTFGNMGENYELTAIKAAGVSLPRIMLPLFILIAIISYGAFTFSNDALPVTNLKLASLITGVRQTRPELDIKERVFYDGVDDFRIKIEKKNKTNKMLYDVMIYDHRDRLSHNTNVTLADSGELKVSDDKKYMVLTLFNGVRYDEKASMDKRSMSARDKQTFRTDHFKSQTALIELQGFDFSKTDEGLLKSNDRMKNLTQLKHDKDSLIKQRDIIAQEVTSRIKYNYFTKVRFNLQNDTDKHFSILDKAHPVNIDSLYNSQPLTQKQIIIESAIRQVNEIKMIAQDNMTLIEKEDNRIARHEMEAHRKFTLPFSCLVFFFIGAPLGAIIRKGGLGLPVVISVLFFIVYYIVNTFGEKMAREGLWHTWEGMWLSSFILLPLGAFLTYKSATDSALLNADAYIIFFKKVFKKRKQASK
jgi:lipopolysaccharide export system permease protein